MREAVPADANAYCDLYEAVAAERRWIGHEPPIDRAELTEKLHAAVDDPSQLRLVARAEDRVVGSVGAQLWIGIVSFGMLVAEDWRGRGVGTALLAQLLDWSVVRDAHKVTMQVWPHNTGAIALYERHGFAVEGRLRRHYRRQNGELWDCLVMGLCLAEQASEAAS